MPESPATPSVALIAHLYPQRGREGYGVFVSEQVRALADAGAAPVAVVVPVPSAPWPLPALSATWRAYAAAERERTDFGSVPVSMPRYVSFPRKALRGVSARSAARAIRADAALMERLRGADALVAHTALLDGNVARLLAEGLGVPYVVVVHGEDLYQNVRGNPPAAVRGAVGDALAGAAVVVAVSTAVADGLRQAFPELRDVRVLHNGVDATLFRPDAAREPWGPGASLCIITASHLVERKAHALVLEAIAELDARAVPVEYTVAGDGPERTRLEGLARYLGVDEDVRFTGAYRHEDLPAMLRACDLLVMPSWDEAFGVVYLEAMACGLPVIAASDGGARDIVTPGVDGYLVEPRSAKAVADAVEAFAALDPAARGAMRAAARAKADTFSWGANARGLLAITADALAKRPA